MNLGQHNIMDALPRRYHSLGYEAFGGALRGLCIEAMLAKPTPTRLS
jgi:hypothetical protein